MKKKLRLIYAALFTALFVTEVCIALFVRDSFVRPYVGDALVTVLLCALCRIVMPEKVRLLPLYVFAFAAAVETAQYFDVVKLLGLEGNRILSIAVGRTFSFVDIICYAAGCIAFFGAEILICKTLRNSKTDP